MVLGGFVGRRRNQKDSICSSALITVSAHAVGALKKGTAGVPSNWSAISNCVWDKWLCIMDGIHPRLFFFPFYSITVVYTLSSNNCYQPSTVQWFSCLPVLKICSPASHPLCCFFLFPCQTDWMRTPWYASRKTRVFLLFVYCILLIWWFEKCAINVWVWRTI